MEPREQHKLDSALFNAAAESCTLESVRRLIEAGADVNYGKNDQDKGKTPLMFASRFATDPDVIKYLVSAGADIHAVSCFGTVAFTYLEDNKTLCNDPVLRKLLREDLYFVPEGKEPNHAAIHKAREESAAADANIDYAKEIEKMAAMDIEELRGYLGLKFR